MKLTTAGLVALTAALIPMVRLQGPPASAQEAPRRAASQQEDGFQLAQRSIDEAIAHLESYLRRSPDGKDAATANIQLTALKNMRPHSRQPSPVYLANYNQKIQWFVDRVERTKDATRVTLKIINLSPDQDCQFRSFTDSPLVIIGDDREMYSMSKKPLPLPKGVRVTNRNVGGGPTNDEFWVFQGGRTLTVDVEFERVPDGVLGGRIQYLKPVAGAVPAAFAFTNEQQNPRD